MIFVEKWQSRKGKITIAVLLVVSILVGFFLYREFTSEQSCVSSIENPNENICFNSMAEALSYISEGAIILPADASQEEIDAAINQYNSEMATREANGE
jgi:hypothetical protein